MKRRTAIFAAATATAVLLVGAGVFALTYHEPRLRGEREFVGMSEEQIAEEWAEEGPAEGRSRDNGVIHQVWPAGARVGDVTTLAAVGWAGERVMDPLYDDWEPAIGMDPSSSNGYLLTTRYNAPKACGNCPQPSIWLYRTTDNGATWGSPTYICTCSGTKAQNDPEIEVASDGSVYAVWMNDYSPGVVFSRSIDHGQSWTAPVAVKSKAMHFTDKPILAISPTGRDVYIAYNSSDSYIVASHNYGASFGAPVKTNGSDGRYYFAGGGAVLPDGSVVFTSSSFTQTSTGNVFVHVMRSTDGGATWTQTQVANTPEQPNCVANGCSIDFYGTIPALAADSTGKLVLTYTGPTVAKGPQRAYAIRSSNGGVSWSAPVDIGGAAGSNAGFTAVASKASGDFRVFFMDDRNGADNWNTFYRASTDGGATWSAEVKISDATSGPSYVHPTGFGEPYGDYGEIAVNSAGKTVATWGEGPDYTGPGGVWLNRMP